MSRQGPRIPAAQLRAFLDPLDAAHVPDDAPHPRAEAARLAFEHGADLERRLRAEHAKLERAGDGFVRQSAAAKTGEDANGPRFARGWLDFCGAVRAPDGGPWRPLGVEAKSCARRVDRSILAEHQRDLLSGLERVGGLALVVFELRDAGAVYALRWSVCERLWASPRGGASLTIAELAGHELVDDARGYLAAFVPGGAR